MALADILLNNYNYGNYIGEAIESVRGQTIQDWRLIIVDDGSTDHSREVIAHCAEHDQRIIPVFKKNGGQLSAFNAGYEHVDAKLVFLLDADDRYHPTYLQRALQIYQQQSCCDFLSVANHFIGAEAGINLNPNLGTNLIDLGYTAYLTAIEHLFVGERTSATSFRKSLGDRMFPIPLESDWRVQADNCLIYMASILGGRKFYLPEPLIDYRVHGKNLWHGKTKDTHEQHQFDMAVERFFAQIRHTHTFLFADNFGNGHYMNKLWEEARTGNKPEWLIKFYLQAAEHLELGIYRNYKLRKRFKRMINRVRSGRHA